VDDAHVDDIRSLTQAIIAGDRDACARFYDESFDLVYRTAYSATHFNEHDTLDIVQDTFLKALGSMKRFDSQQMLNAWLIRVTRSVCIDTFRKRARQNARELRKQSPTHHATDRDTIDWINKEVQTLDRHTAELLTLRFRAGMTLAAIADRLGLSAGAVDGRIQRALQKLRQRAIEQGVDDA
jgi:RNA polymerase sigma-70 factor, ECF subfamily